jgi:hypothetical protein
MKKIIAGILLCSLSLGVFAAGNSLQQDTTRKNQKTLPKDKRKGDTTKRDMPKETLRTVFRRQNLNG